MPTILAAKRLKEPKLLPKAENPAAKRGLAYERKVGRALNTLVVAGRLTAVEHNPWFSYILRDTEAIQYCCPDFILWLGGKLIVAEVKLTWVPEAQAKLNALYLPVVCNALKVGAQSLVICRNRTPEAPPASFTLGSALTAPETFLHWPNVGALKW